MMASRNIKPALENTMPSLYINALKIEANNVEHFLWVNSLQIKAIEVGEYFKKSELRS
jgi:hypothetical protein